MFVAACSDTAALNSNRLHMLNRGGQSREGKNRWKDNRTKFFFFLTNYFSLLVVTFYYFCYLLKGSLSLHVLHTHTAAQSPFDDGDGLCSGSPICSLSIRLSIFKQTQLTGVIYSWETKWKSLSFPGTKNGNLVFKLNSSRSSSTRRQTC